MGQCAYNGGLSGFQKLVRVNLWSIKFPKLLKLAQKVQKHQPLTERDFNLLRHEGTNYDSLLNCIRVTPENRAFFQTVANEAAQQELERLVLNPSVPNPLQQYLKTAQEKKEIGRRIQELKTEYQDRGQCIDQLSRKLGQRKKQLAQLQEELEQLEAAVKAQAQNLLEQEQKLLQEKQENAQLQQQLQQDQVSVSALAGQLARARRRFWIGICTSTLCSLILGGTLSVTFYAPSSVEATSELMTNR